MAEDFHAAFGLGDSPTGLATLDTSGVALAAIQGLNQRIDETVTALGRRDRQMAAMKAENDAAIQALEQRLAKKDAALRVLTAKTEEALAQRDRQMAALTAELARLGAQVRQWAAKEEFIASR